MTTMIPRKNSITLVLHLLEQCERHQFIRVQRIILADLARPRTDRFDTHLSQAPEFRVPTHEAPQKSSHRGDTTDPSPS